jgi:hypothetical protein
MGPFTVVILLKPNDHRSDLPLGKKILFPFFFVKQDTVVLFVDRQTDTTIPIGIKNVNIYALILVPP